MEIYGRELDNSKVLLQGNEAIARGALEANVVFGSGYPGNPSSEIIETLAEAAKSLPIYVEWSTNEKVALEAATAASFSGIRSIVTMKQNGLNVASDFLTNLTLSGTKGGLVLVTCDDPSGISSTNEEDARWFSRLADVPLLEPSTPQEALHMVKDAFWLSEEIQNVVILRSISRLSHTRADVKLGTLPDFAVKPYFDPKVPFHTFPIVPKHQRRHEKLRRAKEWAEACPYNEYFGNTEVDFVIVSSGCAFLYAYEAVEDLGLWDQVGILKIGVSYPFPERLILEHLKSASKVLFLEDVDPFIEEGVMAILSAHGNGVKPKEFFGRNSSHIPVAGETTPYLIRGFLSDYFGKDLAHREFRNRIQKLLEGKVPPREFGFCPGCPHRGTYYAIKKALAWDHREGFVSGDIGCYTMGIWPTGFNMVKSVHAMGSGVGLSSGYGKLKELGFGQPVVTVCGDSTFFHAALPAIVNAKFNNSDILLIVLDNSATAMTGFQPHPGTGKTAMGSITEPISIGGICRSMGMEVEVIDPYEIEESAQLIYEFLQKSGPRVIVARRKCALVQGREGGFPFRMRVNEERCRGEECGCGRYCTRVFRCPGLVYE
ncbi:MAG: thiamine pyrophosphate-dependent enzyme, partial [Desulfatiglandales bacterium]